jgi:putative thioredoxin
MLKNPDDEDARFAFIKHLLLLGQDDEAKVAFAPVIVKAAHVRRFDSLQRWMNAIDFAADQASLEGSVAGFDEKIALNKRDFDTRFAKAQVLMAAQNWVGAMDELLEILMRDKTWAEDLARKTFIAILDLIEPPPVKVADGQIPPVDPVVATYRRRLSSVILS